MDHRWKAAERAIAQRLGGDRVPVNGRGNTPDIAHPWLAIEVKDRERLPIWLRRALDQAQAGARPGQLPVAVLHEAGRRHDDDLVVLRLADFKTWFGDMPKRERG